MGDKSPWLKETIKALEELGGKGTLNEIYERVEARNNIDLNNYIDWQAQIRKHIYLNSSDTKIFKGIAGDESDIFYAVEGKGKGVWGLRSYQSD